MADTLVERLTGQATAADVNVELHLIMPIENLLNPAAAIPAEVVGYGPIPAGTSPATCSAPAKAGCGGGDYSPPQSSAALAGRSWLRIGSGAASTASWPT
jgi:hypothetical protein